MRVLNGHVDAMLEPEILTQVRKADAHELVQC